MDQFGVPRWPSSLSLFGLCGRRRERERERGRERKRAATLLGAAQCVPEWKTSTHMERRGDQRWGGVEGDKVRGEECERERVSEERERERFIRTRRSDAVTIYLSAVHTNRVRQREKEREGGRERDHQQVAVEGEREREREREKYDNKRERERERETKKNKTKIGTGDDVPSAHFFPFFLFFLLHFPSRLLPDTRGRYIYTRQHTHTSTAIRSKHVSCLFGCLCVCVCVREREEIRRKK